MNKKISFICLMVLCLTASAPACAGAPGFDPVDAFSGLPPAGPLTGAFSHVSGANDFTVFKGLADSYRAAVHIQDMPGGGNATPRAPSNSVVFEPATLLLIGAGMVTLRAFEARKKTKG